MQKSLRSFLLVAVVSLAATPALHAGVTGTDPRPTVSVSVSSIAQKLLSFFGA